MATGRARILLGCYRRGEAEDPETYTGAVIVLLSSYPETVVLRVTDPRTGLPGKVKFLPTISEVKDACEAEMGPIRRAIERDNRAAFVRSDKRRSDDVSPERRRQLADALRDSIKDPAQREREVSELDSRFIKEPVSRAAVARYHENRASELAAQTRASPPKLSDAALQAVFARDLKSA